MPSFLYDVEIDWGWHALSSIERRLVRKHEALLQADRKSHTVKTARGALLDAALDVPGRRLRMRAIDDDYTYTWQIADGELCDGGEFDEAGMFPDELTAEDFHDAGVTIVLTPLAFPESMLRTIQTTVARRADSLSAVVQDAWNAAANETPAGFRMPLGPRRMQSVYLPVEIWADLKDRARSEERSMSYLVQRAVTAAYALPVE
jgi:hypothetical protein